MDKGLPAECGKTSGKGKEMKEEEGGVGGGKGEGVVKCFENKKKEEKWRKLTTLTNSWKVMASVPLWRRFSSSCSILCGWISLRNSGDFNTAPKSSQGISPNPSGSNWKNPN